MADGTCRLKVPGGWLYRDFNYEGTTMGICFVPNPDPASKPSMPPYVPMNIGEDTP